MCDIVAYEIKPGHINLTCRISGKPYYKSNKYGMFCEDMCNLKECKKGFKIMKNIMKSMFPNDDLSFMDKHAGSHKK